MSAELTPLPQSLRRARPARAATVTRIGPRIERTPRPRTDWSRLARGLEAGEPAAVLELGQRVTRMLAGWRAYDFRDDWADFTQEVLLATTLALREGRIRNPAALPGYVRATARNKFHDRLRRHIRRGEDDAVPWEAAEREEIPEVHAPEACRDTTMDVRRALATLPKPVATLVYKVYGEERTYREAALEAGIPLGTAKRYLRIGLRALREVLEAA